MQDAQEYLAKVLPWPQDGDPPAYVNIHWMLDKMGNNGKPLWSGRATRSVQEAINTVKWALSLPETKDIYVCMSTQKNAQQKVAKKSGKSYLFPIRGQDNAVALKSLFMDLDAKGKAHNSYDTLAEALTAFGIFVMSVGLPKPNVIVKTGGGFHVYWTFERALTVSEWQPLSNALAAAALAHGLLFDTACTVDSARILRIPNTFNCKLDVRRPVVLIGGRTGGDYLLARLEKALAPYVNLTPKVTPKTVYATATPALDTWDAHHPRLPPINDKDKLSSGIVEEKVNLKDIIPVCPFIKEAVTTGGKGFVGNPLWNLTTLIATMTTGGRLDAHIMCRGSAYYKRDDTDALYDRKEKEHKEKGVGYPACRTIHNNGYPGCAACVHLKTDRSALYAAATVAAQASVAAATATTGNGTNAGLHSFIPDGYTRQAGGVIGKLVVHEDGSQIVEPICRYPMSDGYLEDHPDWTLNFTTTLETGRTAQISIKFEELTDVRSMCRRLGGQGVTLQDGEAKNVKGFLVSWIKTLQEAKKVINSEPFGWSENSKSDIEGFVYGGQLHMAGGGTRQSATPDKVLARRYTPRGAGNINTWVAAAKLITDQKRPALDAIVASSFAAPLVKFCNEPGILMSTYSTKSGIGKTSALKVAQSVWGDPIKAMQGLDDTQNSLFKIASTIRNLPIYWDELKTEEDTKRFVNTAFKLTNQKEKNRLNQNSTMKEGGSWNTLLVSVSNDSLMQFIVQQTKQTTAGINRIFEYEVPAAIGTTGQIDQADASRILGKLDNNYGHVGEKYASYLGSNHVAIAKDVEDFYKTIGNEINTTQEERYWRVMLACLLKGAEYANKLGFTNYIDVPALKKFLVGVVGSLRVERNGSTVDLNKMINVSNAVEQFLSDHRYRHTLYTNKIHRTAGRPRPGVIEIKHGEDINRLEKIRVHVGLDDKILRIDRTYMGEWLFKNKLPVSATMKAMETEFKAKTLQARLGAGCPTKFVSGVMYMIEIDLMANPTLNFIDEA